MLAGLVSEAPAAEPILASACVQAGLHPSGAAVALANGISVSGIGLTTGMTAWGLGVAAAVLVVTGALATTLFGLNFWVAVAGLVIGNVVGAVFMALHSAQGPQLGVPQMVQTRATVPMKPAQVNAPTLPNLAGSPCTKMIQTKESTSAAPDT